MRNNESPQRDARDDTIKCVGKNNELVVKKYIREEEALMPNSLRMAVQITKEITDKAKGLLNNYALLFPIF